MRKYEVDVVVTLTIEAEDPNTAIEKATKIVNDCIKGKTNNRRLPVWYRVKTV